MHKRVLTYDLKNGNSEDYQDLYQFFENEKALKLTESSYLFNSSMDLEKFKSKIKNLTKQGDNVKIIIVNTKNELAYVVVR